MELMFVSYRMVMASWPKIDYDGRIFLFVNACRYVNKECR